MISRWFPKIYIIIVVFFTIDVSTAGSSARDHETIPVWSAANEIQLIKAKYRMYYNITHSTPLVINICTNISSLNEEFSSALHEIAEQLFIDSLEIEIIKNGENTGVSEETNVFVGVGSGQAKAVKYCKSTDEGFHEFIQESERRISDSIDREAGLKLLKGTRITSRMFFDIDINTGILANAVIYCDQVDGNCPWKYFPRIYSVSSDICDEYNVCRDNSK